MNVTTKLMLAITHAMRRHFVFCLAILMIVLGSACSPSGPKALLQGEQLINKGDYDAAVKKLQVASQKLPNYPQVWNFLGLAYHGQGKNQEAIASYQKALSIDRNFRVAYFNMGSLFLEMNRLPEALSALTSYTILEPESEDAWLKLATIQIRLQKPEDAERALTQVLKINPNNPEAYNNLGLVAVQRRRTKEALQLFDKSLYIQADYAPAILNQAVILQNLPGNKPVALQRYRAYLSLEPNSKEAAAVRQTITVLEAELYPPPVKTNPPPVLAASRTNSPVPPVGINAPSAGITSNAPTAVAQQSAAPTSTQTVTRPPTSVVSTPAANIPNTNLVQRGSTTNPPVNRLNVSTNPISVAVTPAVAKPPVQPATATNAVEPEPHTIKPNRTNQVAIQPTSPSSPEHFAVQTASPTETKSEAQNNPVNLETVTIEEPPPVNTVRDVESVSSNAPALATSDSQTNSSAAATSTGNNNDFAISRMAVRERENKPTVLDRMNPSSWFRGKDKDEAAPASVATHPSQRNNQSMAAIPNSMRPAPPLEPKPAVELPRYPFKRQMILPEGDRAAAEVSYNKAVTAHQEKRLASAIESYMEAIKLNPAYFQAYYNLGLAAYQLKDLPLAMSAGEAAVFLRPGSLDARYNFALALRDANYHVDAATQLRELLQDSPDDVRAHFTLANIYAQQLNQPSLASRHYLKVLELDSKHPQASQIRYWLSRGN